MDPILGELRLFGFGFAPSGWAKCQGQLIPISSSTALYSLLGTTYGGDGRTNFALPDLRGRLPLGSGQGPGLSDYTQGQVGGQEEVTLQAGELPAHNHAVAASSGATGKNPSNAFPAVTPDGVSYGTSADMSKLAGAVWRWEVGPKAPRLTMATYQAATTPCLPATSATFNHS